MVTRVLAAVLAMGVGLAPAAEPDLGGRYDLDVDEELAGDLRTPHYGRAAADMVLLLAIGMGIYWLQRDLNAQDWDYPPLDERFDPRYLRFDNNQHLTNHLAHPFAGASYYGFARLDGFGPGGAFAVSAATSGAWEYVLEFRERVSINDLVVTPVAGAPLGEFLHQLDDYVHSAPGGGNTAHKIAAVTFGLPGTLHRLLDGRHTAGGSPDALGFNAAFQHRFRLAYAQETTGRRGVEVEAELSRMPGADRPGRRGRFFAAGNFTELRAGAGFGEGETPEHDLRARATLLGWYGQDLARRGGDLWGPSGRLGLDLGYEYVRRRVFGHDDAMALVHLPGPSAEARGRGAGFDGRLQLAAHPDFAGVQALALDPWLARHGEEGLRTLLTKQGYDYGLGWSLHARSRLEWRGAELGAALLYGRYGSVAGLDRYQEDVTRELSLAERVLETSVWAGYAPPGAFVQARLAVESVDRRSEADEFTVRARERRVVTSFGLLF